MAGCFSERLQRLRKIHGMTQSQLAAKLGISCSTVGMYEQGRREPDLTILSKIGSTLNVPVDYLVDISKTHSALIEIETAIGEIGDRLRLMENVTYHGNILSEKDKEKLIDSLLLAAKITLSDFK